MSKSGRTMSMSALIPPELQPLVSRLGQVSARQAEVAAPMVEEALQGRAPQYVPGMSVPERTARAMVGQQAAEGIPRSPESTMTSGLAMLLPFLSTGLPTGQGTGIFDLFRNLTAPRNQQVYGGEQGPRRNVEDYYNIPLAEQDPNLTGRYPAGLPTGPLTSTGTETTPETSTAINPQTGLREGDRTYWQDMGDGRGQMLIVDRNGALVGYYDITSGEPTYYRPTSGPAAPTTTGGGTTPPPAPAPTAGPGPTTPPPPPADAGLDPYATPVNLGAERTPAMANDILTNIFGSAVASSGINAMAMDMLSQIAAGTAPAGMTSSNVLELLASAPPLPGATPGLPQPPPSNIVQR